jgi:serine/threonine protein phosphatase PrpC
VEQASPVLGRPSLAAASAAPLRAHGIAAEAAFRADSGDDERWAVRAASVAGVRHRLSAQPVQDSFAWAHDAHRLVVAVADGLGGVPDSTGTSGRAAGAAVEAVIGAAGPMAAQIDAGLEAANAASRGGGATTLTLALLTPDGPAWLARVGDSSAFVIGAEGGAWREVFSAPADDTVGTATAALPAEFVDAERTTANLAVDAVLVLVTDGVADPWRDGPTTVAPALSAALARHPGPLELAQLADFSRQGCHDDRTILAVWRTGPAPAKTSYPPLEGG